MKGLLYVCAVVALQFTTPAAESIVCPSSGRSFYPHPTSCSQFVECNNGEAAVVDCLANLHYNPILGSCDTPENVGCQIKKSALIGSEDGDDEASGSGGNAESGEEQDGEDVSAEEDGESGDEIVGENDEQEEEGSGSGGNAESDEEQVVEDVSAEEDGESGNGIVGENDEQDDEGSGSGGNAESDEEQVGEDVSAEEDGESEDEIVGEDENQDGEEGSGSGDANDGESTDEESSNEGSSDEEDDHNGVCPTSGQHFFPHPYNCSQFIECNDGVDKVHDCIADLHFNPEAGHCDFPSNVGCVDSTPAPTTTEPTTTEATGEPVGECPAEGSISLVLLPDSKDCTIFYSCSWGTPILMHCPHGLHFNPNINVCDWPAAAGCTAGQ